MRAVERELHDDNVAVKIEAVEFSVHVGKRGRIDVDRDPNILAAIFFSGTDIIEVPALCELRDEGRRILGFAFGNRIEAPDHLFVAVLLGCLDSHDQLPVRWKVPPPFNVVHTISVQ
jgi:hypothetical protein